MRIEKRSFDIKQYQRKKHTREIAVQSKRISHHDTKPGAKRAVKKVISVLEIAN